MENGNYGHGTEPYSNNSGSDDHSSNSGSDSHSDSWAARERAFDQEVLEWLSSDAGEAAYMASELFGPTKLETKRGRIIEMAVPVDPEAGEKYLRLETHAEQVLPGIPNEITMDQIIPQLSRRDLHSLTSVSRGWSNAFRSHQVHNARVRSHSAETLVLLNFIHSEDSIVIVLYSLKDNRCFQLPIPKLDGGILDYCQFVSLDGKLYALGGYGWHNFAQEYVVSSAVHVLDLAGQRKWKKCARMLKGRGDFGCGVMDGKIYVFGGIGLEGDYIYGSEVYDPKKDTWFPIQPMKSLRFGHHVAIVGEELVMHGVNAVDDRETMRMEFDYYNEQRIAGGAPFLEFYLPAKDEWREVENDSSFDVKIDQMTFVAQGKLYKLTSEAIHIYDVDQDGWRKFQSCSFAVLRSLFPRRWNYRYDAEHEDYRVQYNPREFTTGPVDELSIVPNVVVAADDELLAIVHWCITDAPSPWVPGGFFQSKGFGDENKEIVWEKAPIPHSWTEKSCFMCPILL